MSDLEKLANDLLLEGVSIGPEVRAVVARGALSIKKDWQQRASGIAHAPRYPRGIDYDLHGNAVVSEAVIGPHDTPDDQGFLAPILEYGGAHNSPRNDSGQALDAETPGFITALEALAGRHLT